MRDEPTESGLGEPQTGAQLQGLRDQVDDVDAQMVALLGRRFGLTRQIGLLKAATGLPSRDDVRESHQRLRLALLAEEQGVNTPMVLRFFDTITDQVVAEHEAVKAGLQ